MVANVTPSIPGAPSFCLASRWASRRVSNLQTCTYSPQNRQAGSAFALRYILRRRSCRLMGAFIISPLLSMLSEEAQTAGSLCSADVTPRPRSYEPLRHPLPFDRFPGCSGYTAYLAPPLSRREDEGFSSCSARPCRRAAATTPPESSVASASLRHSVLPSPSHCGLGLRGSSLSGPPVRSLALRPGDSQSSLRGPCRWASGHWFPSSLPSKLQGFWLLPWRDCIPAERASLRWTHNES